MTVWSTIVFVLLIVGGSNADYLKYLRKNEVMAQEMKSKPTIVTTPAPPTTTAIQCKEPIWSNWTLTVPCFADCGACGTKMERRSCLTSSQGCPCSGESQRTRTCRIAACGYPKPACCPPFKLIYEKETFACGPQDTEILEEYHKEISNVVVNVFSKPPSFVNTPDIVQGNTTRPIAPASVEIVTTPKKPLPVATTKKVVAQNTTPKKPVPEAITKKTPAPAPGTKKARVPVTTKKGQLPTTKKK